MFVSALADDEIRQTEGFKNVNLGNVVESSKKSTSNSTTFLGKEDHELVKEWNIKSYEVKVCLVLVDKLVNFCLSICSNPIH